MFFFHFLNMIFANAQVFNCFGKIYLLTIALEHHILYETGISQNHPFNVM
jgi:hypothetical protein